MHKVWPHTSALSLCRYEHVVYMMDALMYSLSKWPREMTTQPLTTSTTREDITSSSAAMVTTPFNEQPLPQASTATSSSAISRFFQRTQSITLNYSNDIDEDSEVMAANSSFDRSIVEEIPLAQQPHLLEPFLKKEEQAATIASRRRQSSNYKLPLSFSRSGIARLTQWATFREWGEAILCHHVCHGNPDTAITLVQILYLLK